MDTCRNCGAETESDNRYCEDCLQEKYWGRLMPCKTYKCPKLVLATEYKRDVDYCQECLKAKKLESPLLTEEYWNNLLHESFQQEIFDSQFEKGEDHEPQI